MGTFDFVIDSLANVVEQANPFGDLLIQAKFRGQHALDSGNFHRVIEHILCKAVAELEPSEKFHHFGMHLLQPHTKHRILAGLVD